MKVHPELVSPYELLTLRQHFQVSIAESTWSLSPRYWLNYLLEGRTGAVATCEPSPEFREKLLDQLNEHLVDFIDPEVLLVLWPPDLKATRRPKGVETHEAFLFVNEDWSLEDGGSFFWDVSYAKANCGFPSPGTLIMADQDDFFHIGPSSVTSRNPRMFFRIISKERVSKEE